MLKTLSLFLLFPAALLTVASSHAQQTTVSNVGGGAQKDRDLNFPVVGLPDPAVARKINDYLQIQVLDQTTLKAPGMQVFNKTKWAEKKPGFDALTYKVHANNGNLLSLGLEGEWMSVRGNSYERHFVFNSQNGEIVFPEDIFTAQGLKTLAEEVRTKRSAIITTSLKKLKTNPDAADRLENIQSELTACNKEAELQAFYTTATGIVFYKGNCLEFPVEGFDANLDIKYSFEQLYSSLTSFGQKLFSPDRQDISHDTFPSLTKPLRGKIDNKYDIVMQLHFNGDNSVNGFYYYNNHQSAIDISGELDKGVLELKEHDADFNDTAVFTGTVRGTVFSGIWTNLKTKKALPFTVKN